jgi:hypothetical protein
VAGIVPHEGVEPSQIRTWLASDGADVRTDAQASPRRF